MTEELRRTGHLEDAGGPRRLMELQATTPSISQAGRYAAFVRDAGRRRRLRAVDNDTEEEDQK